MAIVFFTTPRMASALVLATPAPCRGRDTETVSHLAFR